MNGRKSKEKVNCSFVITGKKVILKYKTDLL